MAQLVLGVAGAAIGSVIPGVGTALGWAIGSAIGGAAFAPTIKNATPRINDLKVIGTEYGQPIPWVQGHPALPAQIWWASDRREIVTTQEQGKGGPSVETTTYTYEVDLLLGFTDNQIAGITRMWINGELIYTNLSNSDSVSLEASMNSERWRRFTVYTGAATQLPDPTYESAVGVGNAPAYRDRGTLFIEGLQLGPGGVIPNIICEVTTSAGAHGGSIHVGDIPLGTWHARCGPIAVDASGISMACLTFTTLYSPNGVTVQTLGHNGSVTTGASYNVATGGPYQNSAASVDSARLFMVRADPLWELYSPIGLATGITMPSIGMGNVRWATRGTLTWLSAGTNLVYRYNGSTLTATSSAVGTGPPQSMAPTASYLYVQLDNSNQIQKLDATTLALVSTITAPATSASSLVLVNELDEIFFAALTAGAGHLWKWDGVSVWTEINDNLDKCTPATQRSGNGIAQRYAMWGDVIYCAQTPAAEGGVTQVHKSVPTLAPLNETIQDVVTRLLLRAGMTAGLFDVSALAAITKPVRALPVSQVTSTRAIIDMLASGYYFEWALSDKLRAVPRGGPSLATIVYTDLGASMDPAGAAEPFALRPANELEIPAQVALTYMNVDNDYQTDTQFSDRLISSAKTTIAVQLALGFTAAEAKAIANTMVMDAVASWLTAPIALPPSYARLEPTDVVTITAADGSTFRMRLVKKRDSGMLSEFDTVLDDAQVLLHSAITNADYTPSIAVALPAGTDLDLLDIPILRDADNDPGFYAAASSTSTPWPGAAIFGSRDDVSYTRLDQFSERAVVGKTTSSLNTWTGGNRFDERNEVTIDIGSGTLSSTTREDMLNSGANALLLGGEILQFRTATLLSPGVYKLSGLLRGRRGTEANTAHPTSGERVVLLRLTGLRRVVLQTFDVGATRYYRAVTLGRSLSSAPTHALLVAANGLKPFSPVDLRSNRTVATGDVNITWSRRTRLSKNFSNGSTPLGETTELYDVLFYDVSFTILKRTISTTTPSVTYTAAQQAADWGSLQAFVFVRIYQVSEIAGRGFYAEGQL